MKLAIMQPYFFPYIGYFQLIHAVEKFVFYDDVNFIKNGWINRNRILGNHEAQYFTVHLKNASSFKPINEIFFTDNRKKLIKTIAQNYIKAPFFKDINPIIEKVLTHQTELMSELAILSITEIANYLDIKTNFETSSQKYSDTRGIDKTDRVITICQRNNAKNYINPIGGQELYSKEDFLKQNIDLFFIKTGEYSYNQNSINFIPHLSIIDILMNCGKEGTKELLTKYHLI